MSEVCTAIVLAGGSGSRMQSKVPKQFMPLNGKPLIWYSLHAVEQSEIITQCVLVTGQDDVEYVKKEILEKYGLKKVIGVVVGGSERYASVWNGLKWLRENTPGSGNGYVFIHDGARPFLNEQILRDTYAAVLESKACVAAVPSKDTVKITDEEGFAVSTPRRNLVWNVQTPQVFEEQLIYEAYKTLEEKQQGPDGKQYFVTDDASVVELFTDQRVRMVNASYRNIKVTTPEDMLVAEAFLKE